MKKLFGILTITALMASCGDGESTSTETTTDSTTNMTNDAMSSDTSMNRMDNTMDNTMDTSRMMTDTSRMNGGGRMADSTR
jgi:ABC-type uncharacterized transport system auxiliary subunit